MSGAAESSATIAGLRAAVQSALDHFDRAPRLSDDDRKASREALIAQLEKALKPSKGTTADFGEIAAFILGEPRVEWGFIQRTASLSKTPIMRVAGGAGAFHHDQKFHDVHRVFIKTDKKHADCEDPDLRVAARQAFEACGLATPKKL